MMEVLSSCIAFEMASRVRSRHQEERQEVNNSGLEPYDLRVVIRPDPPETRTKGGIILPDMEVDNQKYAATKGTLIAAGANAFGDWGGEKRPSPGDRIMYGKYAGTTFKGVDGEDYLVCNDEDVIGRLTEPAA